MYEVFEKLCKSKNVTPYKVSKETGVSRSTLSDWKKGRSTPKTDKLQLIADYFNVPLETFTKETPHGKINFVDLFAKPNFNSGHSREELLEIFETALDEAMTGRYRLTDDEREIIRAYRIANEQTKDIILKILDIKKDASGSLTEAG